MDNPDYLVIGGGSAGAVVTARLSEDPATRVMLVEAGSDTPPDRFPADIADTFPSSSLNPDYFWPGLQAVRSAGHAPRPFPQARVMGGGSSVMGLWALRGMPEDFDSWAVSGADGWSWQDVLPHYRRFENDLDRDQSQASHKPYPIRRLPRDEWPAFVNSVERAAAAQGIETIDDINEQPGEGFFPMPLSQDMQARASSARCYLTESVRKRSNLAIATEARVTALTFEGKRASGALVERYGRTERIAAREIILCMGAIHSPAMLLRSGIGPAAELQRTGIAPLADRPGVGKNLQNHAYMHMAVTLPRRSRLMNRLRRFAVAGIRLSSKIGDAPEGDLLLFLIGRVSPRGYGTDLAMLGAALYKPFSRGAVTLAGANADPSVRIDFNLFDDPRDPPRMLKAARFAEKLLLDPGVAAAYNDAFLLPPVMSLQQFNRPGLLGATIGAAAKLVLNGPSPISRAVVGRALHPGRWFANRNARSALSDEELLAAPAPMAHPVGTCAIGRETDRMAVVDPACRVYGIERLRVIDASVMPTIPSANTNLPTIMVAERACSRIRSGK